VVDVGVQVVHSRSETSHGLWCAASRAGLSMLRWKRSGQLLEGQVYTWSAAHGGGGSAE
jgi:hypothetical protein